MGKLEIKCFFLEPIDKAQVTLRRYSGFKKKAEERDCPGGMGYHNVSVNLDIIDWPQNDGGLMANDRDHDDPLWPTHCDCGYKFTEDDEWQHGRTILYKRSDGGEDTTIRDAPVGAMWNAHWLPSNRTGPDGIDLVVKTPDGDWQIDGPSSNGGNGWTRTGEIPDVTVRPSILMPNYHGWLTNGSLIEC